MYRSFYDNLMHSDPIHVIEELIFLPPRGAATWCEGGETVGKDSQPPPLAILVPVRESLFRCLILVTRTEGAGRRESR